LECVRSECDEIDENKLKRGFKNLLKNEWINKISQQRIE
jgi:hypothetical protein